MSYESNIGTVVVDLTKKLEGILEKNQILGEIAQTILASNISRIHTDGKAVDGSSIGKYSTKPTLAGPGSFATKEGFKAIIGKQDTQWRKVKTKKGKKVTLVVVPGGYKEIRRLSGRGTDKVNLNFRGNLQKEFTSQPQGKDWVLGFSSEDSNKIRLAQEKKWGKIIWGVSESDNRIIDKILKNARIK